MPGGFDGTVKIDTTMDTSAVELGVEQIRKQIESLSSTLGKLGGSLKQAVAGQFQDAYGLGQTAATGMRDALTGATQAAQRSAQEAGQTFLTYAQAIENGQISAQNFAGSQAELDRAVVQTEARLQRLYEQQDKLMAMGANQPSAQWLDTQQAIDDTTAKLEEYRKSLEEARADLAFMQTPEQKAEAHAEGPEGWRAYTEELARLKQQIADDEAEAAKLDAALTKLAAKQEQLLAKSANVGSSAWRSNQYDIAFNESKLEALREAQETAGAIQQTGDAAQGAAPKMDLFKNVLKGLGNALKSAAMYAVNLGKRLAHMGFNAVSKSVKKAVSGLKSFVGQSKTTTMTVNNLVRSLTSLKRLLITRIKRMFISAIFNNVREGIQELARFSSAFDSTMSRIKNNATRLGGNIAVVLGNMITAVEPIITKLIDLLNTATSYVNQFFAVLSGKSTYTAAKMGTEDYAKATEKAAKAQKKLNAELYGFDELTRQQQKTDDSGAGQTSAIQYETRGIDLPQGIMDWIERLKKAWQSGDWFGVGQTVADGLNHAMSAVDSWINTKFRPLAVTWASRIGTIINGLVDGLNWPLLGKTVADGINAVFDTVNTFLKTVNWLKLGQGIGAAIKSWFENIDWALIGETFANKWNALLRTIEGIVTTPGFWTRIGKSIATFIRSWFANFDLNSLTTIIISLFNGITDFINSFLAGNPFEGVAENLSNALYRIKNEVQWGDFVSAIGALFKEALGVFLKVVREINWYEVGKSIGTYLSTLPWTEILSTVGTAIWNAFRGLIEGLFSTSSGRVLLAFAAGIIGLKTGILAAVGKLGAELLVSLLGSIPGFIGKLVAPIMTTLTTTIPGIITGAAPAITGALSALGAVVAPAAAVALGIFDVAAITSMGVQWLGAQKELDAAVQNELDTAVNSIVKCYESGGQETVAKWMEMAYGVKSTGEGMEADLRALAERIAQLQGKNVDEVYAKLRSGLADIESTTSAGMNDLLNTTERGMSGLVSTTGSGMSDLHSTTDRGMHNLGYNVNLTRYDHGEFVNKLLREAGVTQDFSRLSATQLSSVLTGKPYSEERLVSTSYNNFKNAPQQTKDTFLNRAVRIEYKARASTQAMMPGNGPGGKIGEIVLAPGGGRQNYRIVGVRYDSNVGVRQKGTSWASSQRQLVLTVEVD